MPRPFEVQGHRGARGQRPENTLPSFEAALDDCVDSIETDLVLTQDHILLVYHDLRLNSAICRRLESAPAAQTDAGEPIGNLSLKQIREWVADQNPASATFPQQSPDVPVFSRQFADERGFHPYAVPTLDDLFAFVDSYSGSRGADAGKTARHRKNAARVVLDLELKAIPFFQIASDVSTAETALLNAIHRFGRTERIRVRSFDHRIVGRLVRAEPGLDGAVLIGGTAPVRPSVVAREAQASTYCPDYRFLDAELVKEAQAAGLRVIPWTVNEPDEWARLIEWGVDGITTDYPGRLVAYCEAYLRGN